MLLGRWMWISGWKYNLLANSVGPMVQPAECKKTDTQVDAIENITSSANAEVKMPT